LISITGRQPVLEGRDSLAGILGGFPPSRIEPFQLRERQVRDLSAAAGGAVHGGVV
jgi:hypothetical protein